MNGEKAVSRAHAARQEARSGATGNQISDATQTGTYAPHGPLCVEDVPR